MLRDPLQQIASVRTLITSNPEAWEYPDPSLSNLCRIYLQSLAIPLQAAPVGQLLLVSYTALRAREPQVLEAVCAWLGLEPNPFLSLEALQHDSGHWINHAHEQGWQQEVEALTGRLLHEQPWKQVGLAGQRSSPSESDPEEVFTATEREQLEALIAPLQMMIQEFDAQEACASLPPSLSRGDMELNSLVELTLQGLRRHGADAWQEASG